MADCGLALLFEILCIKLYAPRLTSMNTKQDNKAATENNMNEASQGAGYVPSEPIPAWVDDSEGDCAACGKRCRQCELDDGECPGCADANFFG